MPLYEMQTAGKTSYHNVFELLEIAKLVGRTVSHPLYEYCFGQHQCPLGSVMDDVLSRDFGQSLKDGEFVQPEQGLHGISDSYCWLAPVP